MKEPHDGGATPPHLRNKNLEKYDQIKRAMIFNMRESDIDYHTRPSVREPDGDIIAREDLVPNLEGVGVVEPHPESGALGKPIPYSGSHVINAKTVQLHHRNVITRCGVPINQPPQNKLIGLHKLRTFCTTGGWCWCFVLIRGGLGSLFRQISRLEVITNIALLIGIMTVSRIHELLPKSGGFMFFQRRSFEHQGFHPPQPEFVAGDLATLLPIRDG